MDSACLEVLQTPVPVGTVLDGFVGCVRDPVVNTAANLD
jgi:hypothetical protein